MTIDDAMQIAVKHHQAGKLSDAEAIYRKVLLQLPNHPDALNLLGVILSQSGKLDEGAELLRRLIAIHPEMVPAHNNLGTILLHQSKPLDAMVEFRKTIELKPDHAAAHNNIGSALSDLGQPDEAIAAFGRAIHFKPDYADAYCNLGNLLCTQGRLDEALQTFRRAIAVKPAAAEIHSNLCFYLHYDPNQDAASLLREHQLWNQKHAEPLKNLQRPLANDRSPDRQLKIGYVSADFRQHAVGRMLAPLLANHDHTQFEIHGYCGVLKPDDITSSLRQHVDQWHNIVGLLPEQVAAKIREDCIDILLDLSAHTAGNRLLVFAQRPAPIQVTWFTGTTGMSAIDYRLTDPYFDPPGQPEHYSEKSIRLESFWCFQPNNMPDVNALPALQTGHITFGCLNTFTKINAAVVQLWISILKQLPTSKLILKSEFGSHLDSIRDTFAAAGFAPERLTFVGKVSSEKYYELYHQIDIGLDPFPFPGHTTTFDFLWMGVPVVTLAGRTCVGRAGVSILSNLGMPELIAHGTEQYASIAVNLANDFARLSEIRSTLRQRMLASPLMDASAYARGAEAAYRSMWHSFVQATAMSPLAIEQAMRIAGRHVQLRQFSQAESIYREILRQYPLHTAALGVCNEFEKCAIAIDPNSAECHNGLGTALLHQGKLDQAVAAYSRAVESKPDLALAHSNLGTTLLSLTRLEEAVAEFSIAIGLDAKLADAQLNMGIALKRQGKFDESLKAFRMAASLEPDDAGALSNVCFCLLYDPAQDAKALFDEVRLWNQKHADPLRPLQRPHTNDRSPDRKLKIGYVSPDFRRHGVGRMIMPLLSNHDHEQFEISCYSNAPRADAMTEQVKQFADRWLDTNSMSDDQLAARIREDRIDILVDLAAHTAGNRLLVFARKPAPVQITWFTGTTGMTSIDYRLTDPYFDPPNEGDALNTEKLIRLRSFWSYQPPTTPNVNSLPALQAGRITFGCLNTFTKVNPAVLQVWMQILQRVPDSRLLLKSDPGSHRDEFRQQFAAAGITPDRIEFAGDVSDQAYYELYHQVDIGLDPFPFPGHTTTFDFLWMGVPVVTLGGRTCVGRAGVSILSNLGMPELIAQTTEEYILLAVKLANDLPLLSEYRSTLRQRLFASPLMNAPGYARDFEAAYRTIWHTWCKLQTS